MWDRELFLVMNFEGHEFMDKFMSFASGKFEWAPLYILLIVLIWIKSGWRGVLVFIGGAIAIVALSDIVAGIFKHSGPLKNLLPNFPVRFRPSHDPELEGLVRYFWRGNPYGTVSAHAATTLGVAIWSMINLRMRLVYIIMSIYALLVAYSRIYLGLHFPQDILLGWGVGAVSAFVVAAIFAFQKWIPLRRK